MLILLLGSGSGIENGVKAEFKNVATNSIWVHRGQTSKPYKGLQPGRRIQFTNEDYENIKASVQGIEHITARFYLWENNLVTYRNEYGAFNIVACHPDHRYLEKTILADGRLINDIDVKQCRNRDVGFGARLKQVVPELRFDAPNLLVRKRHCLLDQVMRWNALRASHRYVIA